MQWQGSALMSVVHMTTAEHQDVWAATGNHTHVGGGVHNWPRSSHWRAGPISHLQQRLGEQALSLAQAAQRS